MEIRAYKGVNKVLFKLQNSINKGNYYEAHQMYRTLYFRYLGQRRYSDLINLLYNGSLLLLEKQQYTSGADLGILLIDVLNVSKVKPSESYFEKIINLFTLMNPASPEREFFVQNAIKWSRSDLNYTTGHPYLHQQFARVFWDEKNFTLARPHLMYAKDDSRCAIVLIELHKQQGYSNEADLFIAQIVLQYLCLTNTTAAFQVLKTYINQHPAIEGDRPFIYPLLNFLWYLLKAIEMGKRSMFTVLCEQYFPTLIKDSTFTLYLDKIGQIFFNSQSLPSSSRGMLSTLFYSFFNGLESEDSNENTRKPIMHVPPELD